MKADLPVELTDQITGTLSVSIKIGKEMRAHALRLGIDLEEVENAAAQKLNEILLDVASILGVPYDD